VAVITRGTGEANGSLFSYVDFEARIATRHPLRKIRQVVNDALASLDGALAALYTDFGRPSIAPERLIPASLIQILFSVRSERQLMEHMEYIPLFRWFLGLGINDAIWVPTVFSKIRDRLLTTEMSRRVMAAFRRTARLHRFCQTTTSRSMARWSRPGLQ
jgi:transposase